MAEQEGGDLGVLIAAMATDAPLLSTTRDEPPQPGSPIDAALAVFQAACQVADAADDGQLRELHEQRQDDYRSVINDKIGGEIS